MKLSFLLAAICLFSFKTTQAKKYVYPMQVVAGMADLIVTGEIASVSGNSYVFNINQTIKGTATRQIIVKMFSEWTCDARLKKAAPGQMLMLFLTKANDSFDIINGSTGEIFIVDNKLESFSFGEKHVQLEDAVKAFKNFTSCYSLKYKEEFPLSKLPFDQLKTDAEIAVLKKVNKLSLLLFDEMKVFTINKMPVAFVSAKESGCNMG